MELTPLKPGCRFQNFYRAKTTPNKQPPRLDIAYNLDNAVMTVEEGGINRIAHKTCVNRIALQYQQALALVEALGSDKTASSFGKTARYLCANAMA